MLLPLLKDGFVWYNGKGYGVNGKEIERCRLWIIRNRKGVKLFLEGIGEDCTREGLAETPKRIANMCEQLFGGYEQDAEKHLSRTFHADTGNMVVEKDITFYSVCEHHFSSFLWQSPYWVYTGW